MGRTKKFLVGLLTTLSVFAGSLGLAGCDFSSSSIDESKSLQQLYSQYVVYVKVMGQEPLVYEEWLTMIKENANVEIEKVEIDEDGNLVVTFTDGTTQTVEMPGQNGGNDEEVVVKPERMIMPLETVVIIHDYGFYHNQTLNCYYEHTGLDFSAEVGTQVMAVKAGTIESIYKDDLLLGTEIVIDHGDGLKSVYRFVNEAEGLSVGDSVEKGEVIATVAEANGNEYKDGPHLHFEIMENGRIVDPATYLTLEDK